MGSWAVWDSSGDQTRIPPDSLARPKFARPFHPNLHWDRQMQLADVPELMSAYGALQRFPGGSYPCCIDVSSDVSRYGRGVVTQRRKHSQTVLIVYLFELPNDVCR
jgi:hypothetical protein